MDEKFKMELKALLEEEQKDHDRYCELSKQAKKDRHCTVSGILRDIARDEKTHMEAIEHIIEMED